MIIATFDRRQKPGDQCQREGGVFRLGDVLPHVLARAGVTQEPLRKEVAAAQPSWSPSAASRLREEIGQLVPT